MFFCYIVYSNIIVAYSNYGITNSINQPTAHEIKMGLVLRHFHMYVPFLFTLWNVFIQSHLLFDVAVLSNQKLW